MSEKYHFIQGNNWGNKIHIILPIQIESQNKNINNIDLSKKHNYTGWCKTNTTGYVKTISDIKNEEMKYICKDCISYAINSSRKTPEFIYD